MLKELLEGRGVSKPYDTLDTILDNEILTHEAVWSEFDNFFSERDKEEFVEHYNGLWETDEDDFYDMGENIGYEQMVLEFSKYLGGTELGEFLESLISDYELEDYV